MIYILNGVLLFSQWLWAFIIPISLSLVEFALVRFWVEVHVLEVGL